VFTKFTVSFGEELATFGYVVDIFPWKFQLILRIFEMVSQQKESTFVVQPIIIGKGIAGIALESKGRSAE
jgi:hypothetical protein